MIQIVRAKPNPVGKDKNFLGISSEMQRNAEWVDIKNNGTLSESLQGIKLYHLAYAQDGKASWQEILTLKEKLRSGEVLRVHKGRQGYVAAEDQAGATYHEYLGQGNYVWNNREGDQPALFNTKTNEWTDKTWYAPNPANGAVLIRVGDALVGQALAGR